MERAFPRERFYIFAEKEHLRLVDAQLNGTLERTQCVGLDVPSRHLSDAKRFVREYRLCKEVFEFAHAHRIDKVVCASVTAPTLISIKAMLRRFSDLRCVAVVHSILSTVGTTRPPFNPLKAPFWFPFWLSFRNTHRLHYLLLSPQIGVRLAQRLPQLAPYVRAIDHPYCFAPAEEPSPIARDVVRFGAFGVGSGSKGTDVFFAMAHEVTDARTRGTPEFVLVGFLSQQQVRHLQSDSVVVPSPGVPLRGDDYAALARSVDYAVFYHKPERYRWLASGALMDALSYAKPVIALRQPLFEYYFERMGDIGHLCNSYEEMKTLMLDILNDTPVERYAAQRHNILEGRKRFSPAAVSAQLATLWQP